MKAVLSYAVFFLILGWGNPARAITVSGTIRDTSSTPLAGATVRLIHSSSPDTTDKLGKFSILLATTGIDLRTSPGGSRSVFATSLSMNGAQEVYRLDGSRVKNSQVTVLRIGRQSSGTGWEKIFPGSEPPMQSQNRNGSFSSALAKEMAIGSMDTLVVEKSGYSPYRKPVAIGTSTNLDIKMVVAPPVVWPLSRTATPDSVRYPFGPRYISRYDFHAGMDLNTPIGTPVGTIMAGKVVNTRHYEGTGTAGNYIVVEHSGGRYSAYLHLDAITVKVGALLKAGDLIGLSGKTGAKAPHLHLTYMVGHNDPGIDETESRNPMEILPHSNSSLPEVKFEANRVVVSQSADHMTVRKIILTGGGVTKTVDYYEVLQAGMTGRDGHVQAGIYLDTETPVDRIFPLYVSFNKNKPVPTRVTLKDFNGVVLLDKRR